MLCNFPQRHLRILLSHVVDKQAAWVARNADFYKLHRPSQLADVIVPHAKKQAPASQAESPTDFDDPNDDFEEKVVATLKTLVRLFESRI